MIGEDAVLENPPEQANAVVARCSLIAAEFEHTDLATLLGEIGEYNNFSKVSQSLMSMIIETCRFPFDSSFHCNVFWVKGERGYNILRQITQLVREKMNPSWSLMSTNYIFRKVSQFCHF